MARQRRSWVLPVCSCITLLFPFWMKLRAGRPELPRREGMAPFQRTIEAAAQKPAAVWMVENSDTSETYSNGLRIDTKFTVANTPRVYTAFERDRAGGVHPIVERAPAGIVYHTSESCQAPWEADETARLVRLGESLLVYVRQKRAYHYMIDRFGRVYRVVAEADTAYHAGYSVWADEERFYVNLNDSFLGVSFEAQTQAGHSEGTASPAQIRAAAMLTEMLRSRYRIQATDCVTHAQVSVNPSNMLVGYHTDWASGFPFEAMGLPDNYARALPSVWAFGFDYEAERMAGNAMAAGIRRAEEDATRGAAAAGMRPAAYRKALREQYRRWMAQLRSGSAGR